MLAPQTQRENNKTAWDVTHERDSHKARLHNYSNSNKVEMFWAMNESCLKDGIFLLKIGDKQAMISAEEMRRFLRWV